MNKSVQLSAQTHSIQTLQTNPLTIRGTIAKQPIRMLIDSGASLTVINSNLFYQLPYYIRRHAQFPTGNLQLHLADKSCVQVQKTLLLSITIANRTRRHRVYVVPNLWRPCIIGNDFIQRYKLQIDGGRQQVYFKRLVAKKPNALNTKPIQANEEKYTLLTSECIKVPSLHISDIQVRSDKKFDSTDDKSSTYEITSIKSIPCVANGIINPHKCMNIQVASLTNKMIIIQPGQKLATMARLNKAQVNAIHRAEKVLKEAVSSNLSAETEVNLSETNLTQRQKDQLRELIQSFSDVFRKQNGRTKTLQHQIKLVPGSKPFNSPPYRYAPVKRQIIEENLKDMKEEGIIEPSKSPWASPVVLAPKKD